MKKTNIKPGSIYAYIDERDMDANEYTIYLCLQINKNTISLFNKMWHDIISSIDFKIDHENAKYIAYAATTNNKLFAEYLRQTKIMKYKKIA